MNWICRIFGHKAKSLSPMFPTYCGRCLVDLSRNDRGKWVPDPNVFDEMFNDSLEEEILRISNGSEVSKNPEQNKQEDKRPTGLDIARRLTAIRLMMGPDITYEEETEIYNRIYGDEGKINE